jgi:hypothetical protein
VNWLSLRGAPTTPLAPFCTASPRSGGKAPSDHYYRCRIKVFFVFSQFLVLLSFAIAAARKMRQTKKNYILFYSETKQIQKSVFSTLFIILFSIIWSIFSTRVFTSQ